MPEHRAELNPAGLVSDRDLWLDKDGWTVVETAPASGFLLAREGTLIPIEHVQRLGLGVDGGKITQNMDTAAGGPEGGLTPQSQPVPESIPVSSYEQPTVRQAAGAGFRNQAGKAPDAKVEPTPAEKRATAHLTNMAKAKLDSSEVGALTDADEDALNERYDVRNSDQPGPAVSDNTLEEAKKQQKAGADKKAAKGGK